MKTALLLVLPLLAANGCATHAAGPPPESAAATTLLERLAKNPDDVAARLALAETRRAAGDHEGALVEAYKALAADPASVDAHVLRARVYFDRGLVAREVEAWRDALAIAPDRADLRENLGHALLADGRPRDAAAAYRAVLEIQPDSKAAVYNLAQIAFDAGDGEEARRLWRRYLELDPVGRWADRAKSALEAPLREAGRDGP